MHAGMQAPLRPLRSPPTVAVVGGTGWSLGLRLALLKSAGVTEFARVFQNRALRGGPNLMLSRMGGYGELQTVVPHKFRGPNLWYFSIAFTNGFWHCRLQFNIGILVCLEWNSRD